MSDKNNHDEDGGLLDEVLAQPAGGDGADRPPRAGGEQVQRDIDAIDRIMTRQLRAIFAHPGLRSLEAAWRSVADLVGRAGQSGRVELLSLTRAELDADLLDAADIEDAHLFGRVYDDHLADPSAAPLAALVVGFGFSHQQHDCRVLSRLAEVGALAMCPVLSSAEPRFFGMDGFAEIGPGKGLARLYEAVPYVNWRSLRAGEDSRFLVMTLPRVLVRPPHPVEPPPAGAFAFHQPDADPAPWSGAATVLAGALAEAFDATGWAPWLWREGDRAEVVGLPGRPGRSDDDRADPNCPADIGLTEATAPALVGLGLIALTHRPGAGAAELVGATSVHRPAGYDREAATAAAAQWARLTWVFAAARVAHAVMVLARGRAADPAEMSRAVRERLGPLLRDADPPGPFDALDVSLSPVPDAPGYLQAEIDMTPCPLPGDGDAAGRIRFGVLVPPVVG